MGEGSPFSVGNVRLFVWFRVLFNARLYYPIFTVLFLDFGLSLEQFAVLNAVWAASIVLLEVPSGALADTVGRVVLLRVTGLLMVVELALVCFVPIGDVDLVFWVFLFNRVLSGAAEAAASGADEAMAYDSLAKVGLEGAWPRVLEVLMRTHAAVFVGASLLGAAIYDAAFLNRVVAFFGGSYVFEAEQTMRFPLYGVLVMSLGVIAVTWRMEEVRGEGRVRGKGTLAAMLAAGRTTLEAGGWILRTPLALVVILAGLTMDNVVRMALTLNGQYYRVIGFPEVSFGLIGSALALLGIFLPAVARRLVERSTPGKNFGLLVVLVFAGLYGMGFAWPMWGLAPVVLLGVAMRFGGFFMSHYLNEVTESAQRATVLSFRGLSFNLAYGVAGVLYGWLTVELKKRGGGSEDEVFVEALGWFPWYFLAMVVGTIAVWRWRVKRAG
ncbi:MAG: MFS transporter [Verrucomicrobiales bacterium]|nr:MFS transporter [Verrucomicrobiales bacterium]